MEIFKTPSFFQDLKLREVNGFRVKKRPYMSNDSQDLDPIGTVAVAHRGEPSPPMAMSFCKTKKNAHILALTEEGGYITLFNTRQRFTACTSYQENAEKAKVSEWVAHDNSIFDVCWIKDDTNILTASGDQSIKVWDTNEMKCIITLLGHTGSIKSISCHPTNQELVVSGSRDGSFAIWDIRCSRNAHKPTSVVHEAHASPGQRRGRRRKAESISVTSVLHLNDEVSVATAGAVDSVIKFWDTRHLKSPVTQACPSYDSLNEEKGLHGISSLSQDLNGVFITASCMDHRIYLYNILQLEKGPIETFTRCHIGTFFVKSAISPDASHILSGSSDGYAYIWKVNKPQVAPITLKSHTGEVTAVDWCPSATGKVATCSDDFTVCLWNIENCCYSNTRSPSAMRKRVRAFPSVNGRKLFSDEPPCGSRDSTCISHGASLSERTHHPIQMNEVSTPESRKNKLSLGFQVGETMQNTPKAASESPISVLEPLSSLKRRTIRDYFVVS